MYSVITDNGDTSSIYGMGSAAFLGRSQGSKQSFGIDIGGNLSVAVNSDVGSLQSGQTADFARLYGPYVSGINVYGTQAGVVNFLTSQDTAGLTQWLQFDRTNNIWRFSCNNGSVCVAPRLGVWGNAAIGNDAQSNTRFWVYQNSATQTGIALLNNSTPNAGVHMFDLSVSGVPRVWVENTKMVLNNGLTVSGFSGNQTGQTWSIDSSTGDIGGHNGTLNALTLAGSDVMTQINAKVPSTTTVNGHALSSNVVVSASDITTGTLPHAQLPTLLSGDIPSNSANTSGTAAGLSANIAESQVTNLTTDLASKAASSSLATVATSGSYNDLSNKPTIPAAQVNSDWNASSGMAQILNKPALVNTIAGRSGAVTLAESDIANLTTDLAAKATSASLATVATSGSYSDLSNKPTLAATKASVSSQWLKSYDASTGAFTSTQPAYSDITGTPTIPIDLCHVTTDVPIASANAFDYYLYASCAIPAGTLGANSRVEFSFTSTTATADTGYCRFKVTLGTTNDTGGTAIVDSSAMTAGGPRVFYGIGKITNRNSTASQLGSGTVTVNGFSGTMNLTPVTTTNLNMATTQVYLNLIGNRSVLADSCTLNEYTVTLRP